MITVRQAVPEDAPGIAAVHIHTWQTAYAGILPADYLDDLSRQHESRTRRWAANLARIGVARTTFVATDDEQIVGFSTGNRSRSPELPFDAELYAIYILPEVQRRGLGRRLIVPLVTRFLTMDFLSMIVWALRDNPARAFYEKLGGTVISTREDRIGAQSYVEVAYGWSDLKVLGARLGPDEKLNSSKRLRNP